MGLWRRDPVSCPPSNPIRLLACPPPPPPPPCCRALHENEERSAPERLEALAALVAAQSARERELQGRYKELQERREDLCRALQAAVPATVQ